MGIVVDNPARHLIILLALLREGLAFAFIRIDQIQIAQHYGVNTIITHTRLPVVGGTRAVFVDNTWFANPVGPTRPTPVFPSERVARNAFKSGAMGRPKAGGYSFGAEQNAILSHVLSGIGVGDRFLVLSGLSGSALFYIGRVLLVDAHGAVFLR